MTKLKFTFYCDVNTLTYDAHSQLSEGVNTELSDNKTDIWVIPHEIYTIAICGLFILQQS